jgi:stage IV sporulation protein FB
MLRVLTASFSVGRLFGVPVRIQGLFVAFFALAVGYFLTAHGTENGLILSLVLAGAFLFVVVHEFGHAFAARILGVRVTDVTIWPLGGMARLEDVPLTGRIEIGIAAAGPLANLAAAGALLLLREGAGWIGVADTRPFTLLIWINMVLAGFNALPAFPLDGGRILRSGLTRLIGFERATRAAVWVGRVLALALAVFAIRAGLPLLVLLSVFILVSGGREEEVDETDSDLPEGPPRVETCRAASLHRPPDA